MQESILTYFILVTALTTALVAGITLTFAVVVMPGIQKLDDAAFIRAFQVIDGIIQKGQPVFGVVWLGSLVASVVTAGLGFVCLEGWPKGAIVIVSALFLIGVHLPTFTINVPRNNRLQAVKVETAEAATLTAERTYFEATWNRWNRIRTWVAVCASVAMLLIFKTL